jgi:hypothetical protein
MAAQNLENHSILVRKTATSAQDRKTNAMSGVAEIRAQVIRDAQNPVVIMV